MEPCKLPAGSEPPKEVESGEGVWEWVYTPSTPLRRSGERCKLPSGILGVAPATRRFGDIWSIHRAFSGIRNGVFCTGVMAYCISVDFSFLVYLFIVSNLLFTFDCNLRFISVNVMMRLLTMCHIVKSLIITFK